MLLLPYRDSVEVENREKVSRYWICACDSEPVKHNPKSLCPKPHAAMLDQRVVHLTGKLNVGAPYQPMYLCFHAHAVCGTIQADTISVLIGRAAKRSHRPCGWHARGR